MFALQTYQTELIEHSMAVGALKFGTFPLKSGRISPYFINAGLIADGPALNTLCTAFASTIALSLKASASGSPGLPEFDIIFGPAYKGIPFAACTALLLHRDHGIDIGYAYATVNDRHKVITEPLCMQGHCMKM